MYMQIRTFLFGFGHNHTWAPVCGPFHLENYLLLFHPSFYLIHQWQWNRLGVDRANRVASLLTLMSYSPWSCPSPESSWGNLVKTVSLLMVMSQTFATRFSAFMTGNPINGWWRYFTTKIFPWLCHCFTPFHFRVPENCPQIFSEFIPGPNRVQLDSLIVALNGAAMASGMAVTSVPVSFIEVQLY